MSEVGRAILARLAFVPTSIGGVTVIWNLPRPYSELSILLSLGWTVVTSEQLKWLIVRLGWSTKEREGGPV